MIDIENADMKQREDIAEALEEMNKLNVVIDSVQQVQKALSYGLDIKAKQKVIRSVMKYELGMKYRKIKSVSNTGNTPKNLVLR